MTPPAQSSSEQVWSRRDLRRNPHRAEDKPERVRRMFAAIAGSYDLNNRLHSFGRDQAWRRRVVAMAEVHPHEQVLDVACGTGDLTEAFCAAGPMAVTGVDFTPEMLDVAREKANRRKRPLRTPVPRYVQGDAMALPFDDGAFDIVSIAFGIRNVADPPTALSEFRRVLRPGGRLLILEFSQPRSRILRAMNNVYSARVMPFTATLLAGRGGRSGAYHYLPKSVATFHDAQKMIAMMNGSGFDRVTAHPLTFGVCSIYRGFARR